MKFFYRFLRFLLNIIRMVLELLSFVLVTVMTVKIFAFNLFPDYPSIINISCFLFYLILLFVPIWLMCKLVYVFILRVQKKDADLYTILTFLVSIFIAYF